MFDIGFFELLLVGIVGLVVIGPERLPDAVRTTVRWWNQIKNTLNSAKDELEREVGADQIRRELHNERILKELRESQEEMERSFKAAEQKFQQDLDAVKRESASEAETVFDRQAEAQADQRVAAADYLPEEDHHTKRAEDYLPEEDEDDSDLEDPEYPEHLHDHGDPEYNPHHPDHYEDDEAFTDEGELTNPKGDDDESEPRSSQAEDKRQ
ncbi:Sec-independent protein translocase protein TatB [Microbulbifer aggregans]|uniref:Sec-independent protein translocase protein TatB n=1 Tax=Microbulbifer aggregans TaxID=1769779 RepID=UPI001CFD3C56|nr:Sec-independent protein translocase protein TatB [Microbulbifer aggregans]